MSKNVNPMTFTVPDQTTEEWAMGAEPYIRGLAGGVIGHNAAEVADFLYALRAYIRTVPTQKQKSAA